MFNSDSVWRMEVITEWENVCICMGWCANPSCTWECEGSVDGLVSRALTRLGWHVGFLFEPGFNIKDGVGTHQAGWNDANVWPKHTLEVGYGSGKLACIA